MGYVCDTSSEADSLLRHEMKCLSQSPVAMLNLSVIAGTSSACHLLYASLISTQQQRINIIPITLQYYNYLGNVFILQQSLVWCLCFVSLFNRLVKYSSLSTITVEHYSVLANIKCTHCTVWCEPCQDKQTWHIKEENESLLLSHQNKSGKH